ncbi:MAG: HdeD family acid-resistance protein [Methylococcales bacterium]
MLYLVIGTIIVNDLLAASNLVTLVIGLTLIVAGILRAVSALQYRGSPAWPWTLPSGITGILIGFMITGSWRASGLWAIGLFIAFELIVAGCSYILVALAVRKIRQSDDNRVKI